MFKVGKLLNVDKEKVLINHVTIEKRCTLGKKTIDESFKTLSFDISVENYSFNFSLKCKLEKILEIPMNETIDFNDYIFYGETWFNINGSMGFLDPEINIKITRYLKNRFVIFAIFYTDNFDDSYCGMFEFEFNLDDYL
jgi:hypothetical protein